MRIQRSLAAGLLLGAVATLLTPDTSFAQMRFGSVRGSGRGGFGVSIGSGYGGGYYPGSYGYGNGYSPYRSGYGYGYDNWGTGRNYGYNDWGYRPGVSLSFGQSGYSNYGPSYSSYGYAPSYSYGSMPSYGYGGTVVTNSGYMPYSGSGSGYGGSYESEATESNAARVNVRVADPNAEVWFGDTKTTQRGTNREFVSPPLDPSKSYTYEVKARWMENGKEVERTKSVSVKANGTATVDFGTTPPSQ